MYYCTYHCRMDKEPTQTVPCVVSLQSCTSNSCPNGVRGDRSRPAITAGIGIGQRLPLNINLADGASRLKDEFKEAKPGPVLAVLRLELRSLETRTQYEYPREDRVSRGQGLEVTITSAWRVDSRLKVSCAMCCVLGLASTGWLCVM